MAKSEKDRATDKSADHLQQSTIELLKAWAGAPGRLFRKTFPEKRKKTEYSLDRQYLRSETIFLARRDAKLHRAEERRDACENIVVGQFPLERIFAADTVEELERFFTEISSLQTIYDNQAISITHKPNKEFESQIGIARINLIKFFIVKAICCIISGKELNKDNKNIFSVSDSEIRLKHLEMEISNLLREAFAICVDDKEAMRDFQESILQRTLQAEEAVSLPSSAPELFKDRQDRTERAAKFIKRVYAPWLGKGLLRPHLKELDKSLYQSLYKDGVPEEFDELLPKASGKAAKNKGVMEDLEALAKLRASWRSSSKKQYRKSSL